MTWPALDARKHRHNPLQELYPYGVTYPFKWYSFAWQSFVLLMFVIACLSLTLNQADYRTWLLFVISVPGLIYSAAALYLTLAYIDRYRASGIHSVTMRSGHSKLAVSLVVRNTKATALEVANALVRFRPHLAPFFTGFDPDQLVQEDVQTTPVKSRPQYSFTFTPYIKQDPKILTMLRVTLTDDRGTVSQYYFAYDNR
jgi:hypothetical protein